MIPLCGICYKYHLFVFELIVVAVVLEEGLSIIISTIIIPVRFFNIVSIIVVDCVVLSPWFWVVSKMKNKAPFAQHDSTKKTH